MANSLHRHFHALADPTRLAVVEHLLNGSASVSELAKPHEMALPSFTKHLGVLERAGLIISRKNGRVRTCAINPEAMQQIDDWFSNRRSLWLRRFDQLDAYLDKHKET